MQPLRSLLFVPGNKPTWMEKALSYGADALILDLEDSVPGPDKRSARVYVREAIERLHDHGPLPSEDIAYYQGLLAAMADAERQGTAAVTYQGAMVDIAMVKTAQQMLAL
ncbi:MAG TPA: aldolase/citrate lyase family protein, partial [Candidatus Tectomicrobia bacterium]